MPDAREQRLASLIDRFAPEQIDALLVTSIANIRYLTGFSGTSAMLLVSRRERLLVTDYRYAVQASGESGDVAHVVIDEQSHWAGLWQRLPDVAGVLAIGFESAHLVHRDFQRLLESGTRWQWRPTTGVVERLRERKDAGEIACIRAAIAAAESALQTAVELVTVGMTELDVAGALEAALRRNGSDGYPFPTIVAAGPNTALPHARPTSHPLSRGELLLIDFGSRLDGYCCDITRTFVLGPPTARQQEVHDVVRLANERASAAVRPGMSGRDADALARGYIESRGFGSWFGHSLGHGIGLEVHEAPRLATTAETTLPVDAVVTVEPGIYVPEWGGVRIEDDVHLGTSGVQVLTRFPRELVAIG